MTLQVHGPLFKNTFSTPAMRDVFSTERYIDQFVRVEAALATAEASVGMIPEKAAQAISEQASVEHVNLESVERYLDERGLLSMAIIEGWRENLGAERQFVHWGSTSQDVMDTTIVLQVREALGIVLERLREIERRIADHIEAHADTPMIGRTHHVHAVPTTFGLKAASWLDELRRQVNEIIRLQEDLAVCQFGGAVGTYATFGAKGLKIADEFADELGLESPSIGWHAARDRFGRLIAVLASAAGTLSRIAKQVLLLGRPEVGELSELVPNGEVGSSTMPHKQNPKRAETIVVLARLLRGEAQSMFAVMNTADERSASTWYGEFSIIPTAFGYVDRCAENAHHLLRGLEVHENRMRDNLSIHGPLVTSENVMMALAEYIGRNKAHEIVYENAMMADSGAEFVDHLLDDERIVESLTPEEVALLTDPLSYTGLASQIARRSLSEHPRVG